MALIWTTLGQAKMAAYVGTGTPIIFDQVAYGDGNGSVPVPNENQEELVNEVWRGNVNTVDKDPYVANRFRIEGLIPADVGGFTVREVGFYSAGELMCVGTYPPIYKPDPTTESDSTELYVRAIVAVTSGVTIESYTINPGVIIATREYVDVRATGSILALQAAFN
jgi:phage-related tail fiber protein